MVNDREQSPPEQPRQFSKNRFFDGKLMTARDMQTEQRYHAERLETLTRHLSGSGILRGLEITAVRTVEDRLEVTVDAGIAIDGLGRPIIVETPTTKSLSDPDSEQCHLFVRFTEVETDEVAVPDADRRHPDAEAGRVVEAFELTYRQSPPDRPSRSVDLAEQIDADSTPADVGDRIAADFNADRSSQPADAAVYLGGFERTADGSWSRLDSAQPSYVYDNELLYATLLDRITDTDNPHQTDLEDDSPEPTPEELDSIHERVEYLHSELSELKARQETTTTHLLGKTLSSAGRLFTTVADRFTDHHPAVSKHAREIAHQLTTASHSPAAEELPQFCSLARQLQAALVELGERLDGAAHQETVDRYFDALSELQSALEADDPAVEIAIALDEVAEAAVDLEVVYPAVAEQ